MFVDFVNLFSDPEGFLKTSSLWVTFLIPCLTSGGSIFILAWIAGKVITTDYEALIGSTVMLAFGGLSFTVIPWWNTAAHSFTAHGVKDGFPLGVAMVIWAVAHVVVAVIACGVVLASSEAKLPEVK